MRVFFCSVRVCSMETTEYWTKIPMIVRIEVSGWIRNKQKDLEIAEKIPEYWKKPCVTRVKTSKWMKTSLKVREKRRNVQKTSKIHKNTTKQAKTAKQIYFLIINLQSPWFIALNLRKSEQCCQNNVICFHQRNSIRPTAVDSNYANTKKKIIQIVVVANCVLFIFRHAVWFHGHSNYRTSTLTKTTATFHVFPMYSRYAQRIYYTDTH